MQQRNQFSADAETVRANLIPQRLQRILNHLANAAAEILQPLQTPMPQPQLEDAVLPPPPEPAKSETESSFATPNTLPTSLTTVRILEPAPSTSSVLT